MIGFADETYIEVASGHGGSGKVSFRREKFVPKGGPDGGDGGKGGDVVFVVKNNLKTLAHLKTTRIYRASRGENGGSNNITGHSGKDVVIEVPKGTVIKDAQTGEILKDLTGLDSFVFLKGGRGGKGNTFFKSSTLQTPRFAQNGEEGVELRIGVELLLIADIGLVGFPNAGKSSLINSLTNARAKVAGYPFTTKIPNLGALRVNDTDLIIADIPGVIEGASKGAGMGIKFLKHIERTRILAFLVDLSDPNWENSFDILLNELSQYSKKLLDKPRLLIGSKMDIEEAKNNFDDFKKKYKNETVLPLSVFDSKMTSDLAQVFYKLCIQSSNSSC